MKPEDILKIVKIIGLSKKIKRSGWVRENIENPESVAEHSFRVIVLAMLLGPVLNVNEEKLVKMAIIHDLGEVITGDIVTERGEKVDKELKNKKEEKEERIIKELLEGFGRDYHELFHEMIQRETEEAQIFWQLDKLEMAIQASEYEEEQNKNLEEFFVNAKANILHKKLKEIVNAIK